MMSYNIVMDRRNFLVDGPTLWKAPRDSANTEISDEVLRMDNEDVHMQYFYDQIRPIMHEYLDTEGGINEISKLIYSASQ